MEDVQQASSYFWIPLILAYGAALVGWILVARWRPALWPATREIPSSRPWLDLILAVAGVAALFAISTMHRRGMLLPQPPGWQGTLAWNVNVLLIYSPMFLVPLLRRQSADTLYLSAEKLPAKLCIGLLLGVLAVAVFYICRGQPDALAAWARRAVDTRLLAKNFLAVFLEGVAIAFVFIRLRWALSLWPALLVPAVLFAAGHVPNSVQEGRSVVYIGTFLVLNTGLVAVILYVIQRSRDVIWLGIVHYLMDIAIEAF